MRGFSNCGSCSAAFFIPGSPIPPPQFSPQFAPPAAAADTLECGGLPPLFHRRILTPAKHPQVQFIGRKAAPLRQLCKPLSPLDATFTSRSVSVASKELTHRLSPLDATFTKNRGVPRSPLDRIQPQRIVTNEDSNYRLSISSSPFFHGGHGSQVTGHGLRIAQC